MADGRGSARGSWSSEPVDVIVVGRRRLPSLTGVVIHRPKDVERLTPLRRSNIACTHILRTLLDLGTVDRSAVPVAVAHHHVTLATLELPSSSNAMGGPTTD